MGLCGVSSRKTYSLVAKKRKEESQEMKKYTNNLCAFQGILWCESRTVTPI